MKAAESCQKLFSTLASVKQSDHEIVRNLSVITAVEESDGRDSSVVRRPIEIVSNLRHNQGLSGRALAAQARGPGFDSRRRHFSFQAHAVQRSTDGAALIVS